MRDGIASLRRLRLGSLLHRALPILAAAGSLGFSPTLSALDVTIDSDTRHQTIEGWGACLVSWGNLAGSNSLYHQPGFMQAYARDLGCNILRVAIDPAVLTGPSNRLDDEVVLGADLQANIARFNFNHSRVRIFGQVAQDLKAHALEPERVKFMADFWSPPHWLKAPTGSEVAFNNGPRLPTPYVTWNNSDTVGGRFNADDPADVTQFGRYIAAAAVGFEQHWGIEFANLSFSNESTFENPFTSAVYHVRPGADTDGDGDPEPEGGHHEQYAVALKSVKDYFTANGIDIGVRGPHVANIGEQPSNPWALNHQMLMIEGIKDHPDAALDDWLYAYTSNGYDTATYGAKMWKAILDGRNSLSGEPWAWWLSAPGIRADGKPYWVAEAGGESAAWTTGPNGTPGNGAITLAQRLHNALVWGDVVAYIYWQPLHDRSATPDTHSLFGNTFDTRAKKASAYRHFSRYIRPGAQRIAATPSSSAADPTDTGEGVNVSAFIHDEDQTLTVVLLNMTGSSDTVNLALPASLGVTAFEAYRTTANESFARLPDVGVAGGGASLTLPRYSVVTLVGATAGEPAGPVGEGEISFETWAGIGGTSVSSIPVDSTPSTTGTLTSFEIPADAQDNYGVRVRGYLTPPATGPYTFWIASDDNGQLLLSSDATAANKSLIASVPGWTNSRQWNKYATQKSGSVFLTAGEKYYIEALMKEAGGGDHLAVGWARPGQSTAAPSAVIPGSQLSPWDGGATTVGTGLRAVYHDNRDFTGATLTRTDATVAFHWGPASPAPAIGADTFSVRWTGQLEPAHASGSHTYTIETNTDDGVRLWIDGELVIDNWTDHAPTRNSGVATLTAGQKVDITLEYYDNSGGALCELRWASSGAGVERQIIPQERLYPE